MKNRSKKAKTRKESGPCMEYECDAMAIADELCNIAESKKVCAIGASTRGYVILQYANLELPLIERNEEKLA